MEWQAFVGIIAIIGIVIVVGALIAFIGHMIVGAFDNGDRAAAKTNQPTEVLDYTQYKQQEQALLNAQQTEAKDYDFNAIDMAKAKKEQELLQDNKDEDLFKLVDDNDADLESIENRLKTENEEAEKSEPAQTAEVTESDAEDINIEDLIDQINNEVVDEEKEKVEEQSAAEEENPILSAYSIDDILKQANSDSDEGEDEGDEPKEVELPEEETEETDTTEESEDAEEATEETDEAEEVKAEPVEEAVETPVETKAEDDEALKLANQKIAELTSQLENLNKQLSEKPAVTTEVVTLDMTEDECLARIAVLEERLKNAKKDYKINMKEYRPLKKVMNDLERYQTKLRRKEAIVAKKKVALYGVNNYVDIDKEKAEKLANELELLDGLRLSVNHCEDVINANKDRFPILEHTNSILEEQIAQLEQDLELANTTLAKIRERQGEGENNQ